MLSRTLDNINKGLETLFNSTKSSLFHDLNRYLTIPGIVELGAQIEGGIPKAEDLNALIKISAKYLDALKNSTTARIGALIASFEALPNKDTAKLEKDLKDIFNNTRFKLQTIVESEIQQAKALGLLSGIIRTNAVHGVKDPVVFWVVVHDNKICEECKRLHLMPGNITPRLWYLSEVKTGYAKRGDLTPSLAEQHPQGRCALTTLLPGFGFGPEGRVTYIQAGFDAIKAQRGL